jgi:hypothetical protein
MRFIKTEKCIVLSLLLLGTLSSISQTVVIDGEIRPRFEYRDGMSKPLSTANDPAVLGLQRTRLNLFYKDALLSSQITLQDARSFGQTPNASDVATTGIFEAWADCFRAPAGAIPGIRTMRPC